MHDRGSRQCISSCVEVHDFDLHTKLQEEARYLGLG